MNRINLLILHDLFDARFEYDEAVLARKLIGQGHTVHVMTSLDKREYAPSADLIGAQIFRRPSIVFRIPTRESVHVFTMPAKFSHYDIVHACTMFTYSSFIAPCVKSRTQAKLVLRAEIGDVNSDAHRRVLFNPLYRRWLDFVCDRADAITTYTHTERKVLVSLGIDEEKIHVIPVGVDFANLSRARRVDHDKIVLGFFGRLTPQKGFHRLIPLVEKLSHHTMKDRIKLVIAGQPFDFAYANMILKKLSKYKMVQYFGYLENKEKYNFLSEVDIMLYPSSFDTGAIVVLEAMASGCAVLSTNIYPVNEYVESGRTGYLLSTANFADDAYKVICNLISNEALIRRIGSNAQKRATEYDWDKLIREYEKVYAHVLSAKS